MDITFTDLTRQMLPSLQNAAPLPRMFMTFFQNIRNEDTEIVELDEQFRRARVANFVSPDAVADGTELLTFNNDTFKLPTMQDMQSLTGKELKKRLRGENVYNQTSPARKGAVLTAEIQNEQRGMIETRMELMAIDAVFNGQITVLGKGENRVIGFNRKPSHTIDLLDTNYYDQSGGKPTEDIEEWIDLLGRSGKSGTHIIGRLATMRAMVAKIPKDELDNRRIEIGSIVYQSFADINGAVYHGTIKGLELWGYDGNYVNSLGVEVKGVPEKKIAVLSASNENMDVSGYATDINVEFGTNRGTIRAVKDARNFISKVSELKKAFDVEAIQTRAPMLVDPDSTLVVTVLS